MLYIFPITLMTCALSFPFLSVHQEQICPCTCTCAHITKSTRACCLICSTLLILQELIALENQEREQLQAKHESEVQALWHDYQQLQEQQLQVCTVLLSWVSCGV